MDLDSSIDAKIIHNNNNSLAKITQKTNSEKIWLDTVLPSICSFVLQTASLIIDCLLAIQLVWGESLLVPGIITFVFIYIPAVITLILKPPKTPTVITCVSLAGWILKTICRGVTFPVLISVSLLKQVVWNVAVICNKKPQQEILHQYETFLPKEVHSYLVFQAFLHCCPQAVLQMHLVLLQVTASKYTECLQVSSILVAVATAAKCAALFQRYEAQVLGGRTPVLLYSAPEPKPSGPAASMLPPPSCVRDETTALETDCFMGKVVAFTSWYFIIHSRILCLVIAKEIYPLTTATILVIHFILMLFYQIASNLTSVSNIPYKLLNAIFSIVALVEVFLRFHKVTLLYALFFISIVVEDTALTILFFIYSSNICSEGILSCDNFGMYAYLIINSHVIGLMLFGIYLSRYLPANKSLVASLSTSSVPSKS